VKTILNASFPQGDAGGSYSREVEQGFQRDSIEVRYGRLELRKVKLIVDKPSNAKLIVNHSRKGRLKAFLNVKKSMGLLYLKNQLPSIVENSLK
jgi:hypothetical protein